MSGRPQFGQTLSPMERRVLEWMAMEGLTYKQVARRRGVTTKAAESTGHRILVKLGAASMPQAVHMALITGLIGSYHNCGSRAAVVYHQRHGEVLDPKCLIFDKAYRAEVKARARDRARSETKISGG